MKRRSLVRSTLVRYGIRVLNTASFWLHSALCHCPSLGVSRLTVFVLPLQHSTHSSSCSIVACEELTQEWLEPSSTFDVVSHTSWLCFWLFCTHTWVIASKQLILWVHPTEDAMPLRQVSSTNQAIILNRLIDHLHFLKISIRIIPVAYWQSRSDPQSIRLMNFSITVHK